MKKPARSPPAQAVGPVKVDFNTMEPGRLHGATITSWNGPPEINLTAFFARCPMGTSVGGSDRRAQPDAPGKRQTPQTVALSDGTEITFLTNSLELVENTF